MTLNLAKSPDKYGAADMDRLRADLMTEDRRNLKRGGEIEVGGGRVILTSPNGTRYALAVSNAGALSATAV